MTQPNYKQWKKLMDEDEKRWNTYLEIMGYDESDPYEPFYISCLEDGSIPNPPKEEKSLENCSVVGAPKRTKG